MSCTAMTARGICNRPLDDEAYANHFLEHIDEPDQPIGG